MFCTTCAAVNTPGSRRCAGCGSGLAVQPTIARVCGIHWQTTSSSRVTTTLLYRLPIVLILALAGIGGVLYQHGQADRAASYAAAETALAAGDYDVALHNFAQASGYRDADARYEAERDQLQPYRLAYLDGVAALDARRYEDAIASLLPVVDALPDYRDAPALLAEAQQYQDVLLLGSVATAERQRDWLAAEQTLLALTTSHPGDADLAARLRTLRQAHAPLALARNDGLYLIGPDGGDQRLLTNEVPVAMPAWDPARSRIAFLSRVHGQQHAATLYVIDGDGNGLRQLATDVAADSRPVWNPAGARIAYSRDRGGIGLVELTTGRETIISTDPDTTVISPTWAPDGQTLAMIALSADSQGRPSSVVQIVDIDLGLRSSLPGAPLGDAASLAWNPVDNRLLVYQARLDAVPGSQASGIMIIDLDSGGREPVARDARLVLPPVWSPDGTRIAYVEGNATIRIRRPGTLGEAVITVAHPLSGDLLWMPGGSALLALAAESSHPSFLIPLSTRAGGDGPSSAVSIRLGSLIDNGKHGPPAWSGTHLPMTASQSAVKETR